MTKLNIEAHATRTRTMVMDPKRTENSAQKSITIRMTSILLRCLIIGGIQMNREMDIAVMIAI